MRLTAILLAGLLLSACQSQRHYPADSPYSRIPVGSVFTLHQPLTIPIEDVAIKIQDGEAKVYKPIYFFDVWCEIELKSRNPEAYTIEPGDFTVTRVREDSSFFLAKQQPLRLASLGPASGMTLSDSGSGGAPTFLRVFTEILLKSETQPAVGKMTCKYDTGEYWDAKPIGIDQIRHVLGDLFTLTLAASDGLSQ